MRRRLVSISISLVVVASGMGTLMAGTSLGGRAQARHKRSARPTIVAAPNPSVAGQRLLVSGRVPGAPRGTPVYRDA